MNKLRIWDCIVALGILEIIIIEAQFEAFKKEVLIEEHMNRG